MLCVSTQRGRKMMGRLEFNSDLMKSLTDICEEKGIRLGEIRAIGAIQNAVVGYYDQKEKIYRTLTFNEPLEIISLSGNISTKDGLPMVHAHVGLMREDGAMVGGHLMEGCTVWACEYVISELMSDNESPFERTLDNDTALYLWVKE